MSAFVKHDFDRGFLLDEQTLRKLRDLIQTRTLAYPTPVELTYRVYRGDSHSYETQSVEDVISEENEDWRAIARLDLLAVLDQECNFRLSFSSAGVQLEITGANRDAIFLLLEDIRGYLGSNVLVRKPMSARVAYSIGMAVTMSLMLGILYSTAMRNPASSPDIVARVLDTTDVAAKLNFLIEERRNQNPSRVAMGTITVAFIFMLAGSAGVFQWAWKQFFPANLFLFGKRKESFERRRALVDRIVWGVGIARVVSLAGSAIFWLFTRS